MHVCAWVGCNFRLIPVIQFIHFYFIRCLYCVNAVYFNFLSSTASAAIRLSDSLVCPDSCKLSRFIFLRDRRNGFLRTVIRVRLSSRIPVLLCRQVLIRVIMWSFLAFFFFCARSYMPLKCSCVFPSNICQPWSEKIFVKTSAMYRFVCSGGYEQDILRWIKKMNGKAGAKAFFFKLNSGTLPVKQWLANRGLCVPWATNCLFVKRLKTIEHVFLHRWDAVFHW